MTANPNQIEAVTSAVRGLFHRLRAFGDRLHADLGITTAMRGVMESLARSGPMTVPQMARQRPVSRQHIQMLVNQLTEAGLCTALPNPEHKRSVLIDLTGKGREVFEEIRRREAAAITELFGDIAPNDLAAAERALSAMTAALDRRLHLPRTERDNDDDDD
jgi:DNA-binding MarR family transcriptional regulator